MSLQKKLTFLFTGLIGGLLGILGLLVYGLVNTILLDQIDLRLSQSAQRIINGLSVTPNNQIISDIALDVFPIENQYFQIWKNSNELLISRPTFFNTSLDENGLKLFFEIAILKGQDYGF